MICLINYISVGFQFVYHLLLYRLKIEVSYRDIVAYRKCLSSFRCKQVQIIGKYKFLVLMNMFLQIKCMPYEMHLFLNED
jgi:hypothetical protein